VVLQQFYRYVICNGTMLICLFIRWSLRMCVRICVLCVVVLVYSVDTRRGDTECMVYQVLHHVLLQVARCCRNRPAGGAHGGGANVEHLVQPFLPSFDLPLFLFFSLHSNTGNPRRDGSPRTLVSKPVVPYQSKMAPVKGVTHGPMRPYRLVLLLPSSFLAFNLAKA
jgi:hypothetical protein